MLAASTQADGHQTAAEIKRRARALGFDLVGIAGAEASSYREYLRRWLDDGRAGVMEYLGRRFEERVDPGRYVPGAASVICAAMNYHVPLEAVAEAQRQHHARIARYALGDDYHELLKERLWKLADWLREAHPGVVTRTCVDTAPVMEKEAAARAGIGWVGKNTCVIHPKAGSWLLLGEIITTLALPADEAAVENHCGTCRRCIDACPTGAITAPYQLDARRCISYLTIEHPEPIPEHFHAQMGEWLYGCDVCQEVCPFNDGAPAATDPALRPRFATGTVDVREVLSWRKGDANSPLRHSAMRRVKLEVLQRNARIVERNLGGGGEGSTGSAG